MPYVYNDLESVERGLAQLDGDCAAIFVGGCSYPYSGRTELPTPEFALGLRKLADASGALLVLDEIRTNFRVGTAAAPGHWAELAGEGDRSWRPAVAPDLYCMCKALANGHPLAALIGNERARAGAAKITASGTYWLTGGPMAAALATIDIIEADGSAAMRHMQAMGERLTDGLRAQVRPLYYWWACMLAMLPPTSRTVRTRTGS
eukprot:SAG31_NODE_2280_length_6025_cov_8.850321_3_plen_205_part_00